MRSEQAEKIVMDLKRYQVFGMPLLYFLMLLCTAGISATAIYQYLS